MADYGRPLQFGAFITPSNSNPDGVVALATAAEQTGLDLLTFQDHPYQAGFLDTWTLISYLAARTEQIMLAGNVINLPLRPPAVLARSVASLDLLTGGRIELGLGAGAFWDAIEAMGGRRLEPREAVDALEEAIAVIRQLWDADRRGGAWFDGDHYRLNGAKRGPAPAHRVGIWLGAYKPRMLRLTGRLADGWLPSEGYLQPGDLERGQAMIDRAAVAAGRAPGDIRRLLNVSDLDGDHLTELALIHGIDTFIAPADDPAVLRRLGELAVQVRERVAAARAAVEIAVPTVVVDQAVLDQAETAAPSAVGRSTPDAEAAAEDDRLGLRPTPDDGVRLADRAVWREDDRPHRTASGRDVDYTSMGRQVGQHLIDVHDHLRRELTELRDLIDQVRMGALDAAAARSALNDLTLRQNDWTLGAYCASYCRVVAAHHGLEDESIFPHLRAADRDLGAILDRLAEEHHAIHDVLTEIDRRLVELIENPGDHEPLQQTVDLLTDALLSHLSYEERELVEPLARHGFYSGQV